MKKAILLVMLFCLLFTSFSFALDLNTTVNYLARQELDAWGILALYSNSSSIENQSLEEVFLIMTDYESYIMEPFIRTGCFEYAVRFKWRKMKICSLIHTGNYLVISYLGSFPYMLQMKPTAKNRHWHG